MEWARSGEFDENLLDNVFDAMLREIETEHYSRHPVKKNVVEESSSSSSKQQESKKEEDVEESEEDRKLRLARERLQRRGNRKPRAYKPKNKKGKNKKEQKKDKKKRDWDLMTKDMSKITKKDLDLYDRSSASNSKGEKFGCARGEKTELEISLSGTTKPEDRDRSSWSFAGFSDFVKSKTSNLLNKELERSDLNAALETMRQKLVSKNVAVDIAAKLCDSVAARLVGKRLNTFTRVGTIVQEALCESIERILTPKRSIDVLRSVRSV